MKSDIYIRRKYNDIISRSFSTKLDIFLFTKAIRKGNLSRITTGEFKRFQITKECTNMYQKAWQLAGSDQLTDDGPTMDQVDKMIEAWNKNSIELKEELLKQYKVEFQKEYFPFGSFEKIYDIDPSKRICHYCKVSDTEIEKLRSRGKIYSKVSRGYSMEIDRLEPNMEYSENNCVLACYWCNNAKTDEFNSSEFEDHIGPGIGTIWEDRKS